MKYELKKIFNSTLCRTAVFIMAVLFSVLLYTQIQTVNSTPLHTVSELSSYKENVHEEAESLSSSFLFHTDETQALIAEKKDVYYSRIEEPHGVSKTYDLCFDNRYEIMMSAVLLLVLFYQCITYEKEEGYSQYMNTLYANKRGYRTKRFILLTAIAYGCYFLTFLVRLITGIVLYGYQSFTLPVQSVNALLYCPYAMHIGTAMAMMLLSAMITMTVTAFLLYTLSCKVTDGRTLTILVTAVFLILYFAAKIPYQSVFVILKLLTWNDFRAHMQAFSAVIIGRTAVMSWVITGCWYLILLLCAAVLSRINVSLKITNTSASHRRFRKRLFLLEVRKMMRMAVISICAMLIAVTFFFTKQQPRSGEELYYGNYYLNELEGLKNTQKDAWIRENEERFETLNEEYFQLMSEPYSISHNTRISELEMERMKEKGFRKAAEIYGDSSNVVINTYAFKETLRQGDLLLFIAVQLFLIVMLVYQFVTYDRRNRIDTLLNAIPDYRKQKTKMDQKILMAIIACATVIDLIHIIRISNVFVNSPYALIKGAVLVLVSLLIILLESVILRLFVS